MEEIGDGHDLSVQYKLLASCDVYVHRITLKLRRTKLSKKEIGERMWVVIMF